MMKIVIQIILFLFPWKARRFFLKKVLGFKISKSARLGYSIILADEFIMEDNSNLGHLTLCKNIDKLILREYSSIGALNFITGFNSSNRQFFSHKENRKSELILSTHSAITSRHFLDCNDGIYIGKYSTVAGIRSTFLSHSIDVYKNRQDCYPIIVGEYCFIGTGCVLLGGSVLADYSVLGAGAVLNKTYQESNVLVAGIPARPIKKLSSENVEYFSREKGFVH